MNRLQLYRLLRHHGNLAFRRSPAWEQNMVAKVFSVIGGLVMVAYLIGIGTALGLSAADTDHGLLLTVMLFLLIIDFFVRFAVQQTPDMLVKPYILLPISKYTVIESFLLSSVLSTYNLLWLALFLPYSVVAIAGGCSWGGTLVTLFAGELLLMLNSQVYLLMRTLVNRHQLWWLLAIAVYGLPFVPVLFSDMETVFEAYVDHARPLPVLAASAVLLGILLWLNRQLQFRFVYEELSRQEKTSLKHVSEFGFLNRFGEAGEYLKLELKGVMRTKVMRQRCISSLTLITIFTLLIAYTPFYDGQTSFWCFYCFALYGVTSLAKVMGPEGNYIDLLMTHRENILSLLRAKYYFHLAVLVVPFVIMIPALVAGKFALLQMLGYMCISGGLLYFTMFQLAVYNKQTLPLNQKLTGKGNFENGLQLAIELAAFIVPILVVTLLTFTLPRTTAYAAMCLIGLAFIAAHPWWLRNIYRRMMKRRYENLEGFHATR